MINSSEDSDIRSQSSSREAKEPQLTRKEDNLVATDKTKILRQQTDTPGKKSLNESSDNEESEEMKFTEDDLPVQRKRVSSYTTKKVFLVGLLAERPNRHIDAGGCEGVPGHKPKLRSAREAQARADRPEA